MTKNDALFEVGWIVTPSDFYETYHGELWRLITDQVTAGREVSPSSLLHDMAQDREVGQGVTAMEYLRSLAYEAPPAVTVRDLARQVRDLAGKREMLDLLARAQEEIIGAPASLPFTDILGHVEGDIARMLRTSTEAGIRQIGEVGDDVLRKVSEAGRNEKPVGLSFGLACVEDLIGPLMPGRLYGIAGASGFGKSGLVQQIGMAIAERGSPGLLCEIEMEDEEVAEREMAQRLGISASKIESGALPIEQEEALYAINDKLKGIPFYIDAASVTTMAQIRAKAMRMKRLHGIAFLIVDHLLYIGKPDPKMHDLDAIRPNLQSLKRLAKDLGIPVIIVLQLKQEYAAGPVRRPTVADCYGGSAIEQEVDVLLLLYREEYMLRRKEPNNSTDREQVEHREWENKLMACEGKIEFILGKRRGGRGFGSRIGYFDAEITKTTDTVSPVRSRAPHILDDETPPWEPAPGTLFAGGR